MCFPGVVIFFSRAYPDYSRGIPRYLEVQLMDDGWVNIHVYLKYGRNDAKWIELQNVADIGSESVALLWVSSEGA